MAKSEDYFEDVPDTIGPYLNMVMATHPAMRPADHPPGTGTLPHVHVIRESLNTLRKNELAEHIEAWHKEDRVARK